MSNVLKCPRCGSRNIGTSLDYKIKQGLGYAGEFAIGLTAGYFFGEAGGKLVEDVKLHDQVEKEYECSSCGYKWTPSAGQVSFSSPRPKNNKAQSQTFDSHVSTSSHKPKQPGVIVTTKQYSRGDLLNIIARCDNNPLSYSEDSIINSSPKELRLALQANGISISTSALAGFNTYRGLINYILEHTRPGINSSSSSMPAVAQQKSTSRPNKQALAPFVLPIEDKFYIEGRGTVVTGRVAVGKVEVNDELFVVNPSGNKYKTVCMGIEMFRKLLTKAEEGDNCGILLKGVSVDTIQDGAWLQRGEKTEAIVKDITTPTASNKSSITTPQEEKLSILRDCSGEYSATFDTQLTPAILHFLVPNLKDRYSITIPDTVIKSSKTFGELANFLVSGTVEMVEKPQKKQEVNNIKATSDEQEYVEMYKEYVADGEISERDRKMLDKFRSRLGISEERARALEKSCSKPQLTEDEQEYLEMYKEYAADGEISERDWKMLNKMRDRMGISEERAKEIEKL